MSNLPPSSPPLLAEAAQAANELLARRQARISLLAFSRYTKEDYETNWHHKVVCDTLDKFVAGQIQYLMVFMPPQTGKSELVSRRLPAYWLGKFPKARIAGVSYAHSLASKFNRDVQRIIDSKEYHNLFPETRLNDSNVRANAKGIWLRNADEFEIVEHAGGYISVGIGGGLTGNKVDLFIIDDPVKDKVEATSLTYQQRNIEWWDAVAKTRLRNTSQVLLCNTRWDEGDLSGRLLDLQREGKGLPWHILSFPAIKENDNDAYDIRAVGEALWPSQHSLERMLEIKSSAPVTFKAMYQQDPTVADELKIYPNWRKIEEMPEGIPFYGLDFGFTNDPSVLVECKVHKGQLFVRELIYQSGLITPELAQMIKDRIESPTSRIYADSADPKTIEELKKIHGLNVTAAEKGPDSVRSGINKLKTYVTNVTADSLHLWHEQKHYQFHLLPSGKPSNEPMDAFNHGMDAIRYAVTMNAKKKEIIIR